jgi:uncharacterized DUF497 family protein
MAPDTPNARSAPAKPERPSNSLTASEFSGRRGQRYSFDEERFVTFGISTGGHLLAISHTDRDDTIRIISARPATPSERKIYEEG